MTDKRVSVFPPADYDARRAEKLPETPQTRSPSFRLAFRDTEFLELDELRPVRLQLELLKPEMILRQHDIASTVVMFGGARIPSPEKRAGAATRTLGELSHFYEEARKFAALVGAESVRRFGREFVICTGGGPGVMEAGSRGANEVGARTIGLGIVLPREEAPNAYVTPELSFNFHYFAIRKMHFLMRAKAISVFPGGFGTLDELFETLTLIQTKRMEPVPVLLFGREFWTRIVNWEALADAGTISPEDLKLFRYVETAEEGWDIIREHLGIRT
ncbi:MAG TPA: LOG family protein [Thermohalobaculum sp.]|nr:LOG family protein [Thermohalobaculum sp.]